MVQLHLLARARKRRRPSIVPSIRSMCRHGVAICQARHGNASTNSYDGLPTWFCHIPTHDQNYRGAWSPTQPPRTAHSATSSTSTSVRIIISVSACHHAKTEASVSIVNCTDNGTNVSSRFAHPRFVSFHKSTTRRINARRTHCTLKCSLVERLAQRFAYTVAREHRSVIHA